LAARAIVAIENPADVSVISSRNTGQVWEFFIYPRPSVLGAGLLPCSSACHWQLDKSDPNFGIQRHVSCAMVEV